MLARRASISPAVINNWFTHIGKATNSATGNYYKLDFQALFAECQRLTNVGDFPAISLGYLASKNADVNDAIFLTAMMTGTSPCKTPDRYFLTIFDEEYLPKINKHKCKITGASDYWFYGKCQLHKFVYEIKKPNLDQSHEIHHKNFCAFDNREKNLVGIHASMHRIVHHNGPGIEDEVSIETASDLARLIIDVF